MDHARQGMVVSKSKPILLGTFAIIAIAVMLALLGSAKYALTERLISAGCKGDTKSITFLLNFGVPVDSASDEGLTALQCASANGFEPAVRILLNHGGNPTLKDIEGNSALDVAASQRIRRLLGQTSFTH